MQAVTYCELYSIGRKDVMALVALYPSECIVLRAIALSRKELALREEMYDDGALVKVCTQIAPISCGLRT